MKRALLFVWLLLCASYASALVPTGTTWEYNYGANWYPTGDLACDQRLAAVSTPANTTGGYTMRKGSPYTTYASDNTYVNCKIDRYLNNAFNLDFGSRQTGRSTVACPANSTAVTGGCQCAANYDESGGQCVPHVDQCSGQTGRSGLLNWTEGYTRTPDEGDRKAVGTVYSPPSSGNVCNGGCQVSLQTSGPGVQPMVSQSPTSQGLYRRSVDYPYLALGKSCTAGVADVGVDKNAAPPDCPGTVGEYSGKPACVGTAAKPVTTAGMPAAPGSSAIAGNPSAGDKPSSGEASGSGSSGRTPSGGDGSAKGGPADAGKGGKGGDAGGTSDGTGTSPKATDDKQPDPCGAPGQAECAVKVNEKGTPDGAGTTFDDAKAKLDARKTQDDQQRDKVSGSGDKGFLEPVRQMFWAPPVAACEPYDLPSQVGSLKIDPCGVADGVRFAMAFVWAGAGLFMCLGMVKRSF